MKETSVFLPEKEMKKKYTALANEGKKKSVYFFPSMICGIIVIFWLTYLTIKVEEKDVLIRDDDTIEGNYLTSSSIHIHILFLNLERENNSF